MKVEVVSTRPGAAAPACHLCGIRIRPSTTQPLCGQCAAYIQLGNAIDRFMRLRAAGGGL